jgi:hypothetical protein
MRVGSLTQERAKDPIALGTKHGFAIWVAGGMLLRQWQGRQRSPAPTAAPDGALLATVRSR